MKFYLAGGILVALFSFSSVFGGSKEEAFWSWFRENSAALWQVRTGEESVVDDLASRMSKVDPDLTFEFGPVRDNRTREFVISAGGARRGFPAVEALFASAPALPDWKWVKFRPRRATLSDIEMNGRTLPVSSVRYNFYRDGDKVGIVLFVNGYSEAEENFFGQAGFLMLDEALGEYAVETQVGFIEFAPADDSKASHSRPISEIADHFDEVTTGLSR